MTKPRLEAQLSGPRKVPKDDLDERAWLYYYENYSSLPADPMLLSIIKGVIVEKDMKDANKLDKSSK